MFKIAKTGQQLLQLFTDVDTMEGDLTTVISTVNTINSNYASKSYVSTVVSDSNKLPSGAYPIYCSRTVLVTDFADLPNNIP